MIKLSIGLFSIVLLNATTCRQMENQSLIYQDSFSVIDSTRWHIESESSISYPDLEGNGYMDINVPKGITVWFTQALSGNIAINFKVTVVDQGGPNDRVSDLNCFWMATDPHHPDNFFERSDWRGGIFWNYYPLNLYYVGLGGHDNTKTRFRKYNGKSDPQPQIIREYTDAEHLIQPNIKHDIRIVCQSAKTQYFFDGEMIFELEDTQPYQEGYFGFRTVNNHLQIHDFAIERLK